MKLVSVYLALFLTTILLVTADAAPRGLKAKTVDHTKTVAHHLMHRHKKGADDDDDDDMVSPPPQEKESDTALEEEDSDCVPVEEGDDNAAIEFAVLACMVLETFDHMGRRENNDRSIAGLSWELLCDDFESVDELICPTDEAVDGICSHKNPHLNPAVKEFWCIPVFEVIEDGDLRAECIKHCVNYVSNARGDCCGLSCAKVPEYPIWPELP